MGEWQDLHSTLLKFAASFLTRDVTFSDRYVLKFEKLDHLRRCSLAFLRMRCLFNHSNKTNLSV